MSLTRADTTTPRYAVDALGIRIECLRKITNLLQDELCLTMVISVFQIHDLPVVLEDKYLASLAKLTALRRICLVAA
jgi:hypothetical protein